MRFSRYLVISCGSRHLVAAHLQMNASGRCDVVDYCVEDITFESSDPLLWLKAASEHFEAIRGRFPADLPVVVSIPGHLSLTKYLKIPQVVLRKRSKIIAYEVRQNIPYPISEVTWGDCLIDEDDLDFEAVIAATKTDFVEALARYAQISKLKLESIEPTFISLLNGFRYNYPEQQESSLIVSVGAKSTDLIYTHLGKFFSRNVSVGGDSLTREIADALSVSIEEAEQMKRDCIEGSPVPTLEYETFELAARSFLQRLATEISRTTAISKRHGILGEAKACFVTGGGALLPGIEDLLFNRLGIPVARYDPLRKVRTAPALPSACNVDRDREMLAGVVGAGIGQFVPDSSLINLMPRSVVWQRKFRRQQPYFLSAGLVACAAVCLPLFNTTVAIRAYEQEIQNLDAQIDPIKDLNNRILDRIDNVKALQKAIESFSEIGASRANWIYFINDLQDRLISVEDVWLNKLEVIRAQQGAGQLAGNRSGGNDVRNKLEIEDPVRLRLAGRLLDVENPMSSVSQDSYVRVKSLLENIAASRFILGLEDERFDNSVPGILKFDFTLIVDPTKSL